MIRDGLCRAGLLAPALLLAGCVSTVPTAPAPATAAAAAAPVVVTPQRDWSDAILYFAIVDRFADGDPANNARCRPCSQGDVPRRRPQGPARAARRDRLAGRHRDLDHAGGQEHRRLRDGRRVPGLGLPRLLGRRLQQARPALRQRGGPQGPRRRLPPARHEGAAGRGLQPRRLRVGLPEGPGLQGLAALRGAGDVWAGRHHVVRRRPAGLQDRAARGGGLASQAATGVGQREAVSTASGSTRSSTSPTTSGRSTGGARAPSWRRGSFCSARCGAATRRSSTPTSPATRWTRGSTSPSRATCWGSCRGGVAWWRSTAT